MELKYTICFIRREDSILLLNRESPAWMGAWNGVGGKIEAHETPHQCIIREIEEETGIAVSDATYKGQVTWERVDGSAPGGMYAFVVDVPTTFDYRTPIKKEEGILDWKKIDWIMHPDNGGVANLRYFLPCMLTDDTIYKHEFLYDGDDVADFQSIVMKQPAHTK